MRKIFSTITYHSMAFLWLVIGGLVLPMDALAKDYSAIEKDEDWRSITGTVTEAEGALPLVGVTVMIKGTTTGTVTDVDGNYQVDAAETDILVFSYLGYQTQEISVGNQSRIDVKLAEAAIITNEVVVTALGLTREEKSLGFSVERLEGDELRRVTQENVLNGLAGKVAGVTINSTGGTGSSVSMVIRGATSLSSDNQPLFVVDGVPLISTLNNITEFGSRNPVDYGNAISDINPDDIENVSILKGPSAAALYGSRAGNGVVLITTKSGKKSDGVRVSVSSNTVFDQPFKFFKRQYQFAPGFFSFTPDDLPPGTVLTVNEAEGAGAGIELDKGYFAVQWNSPRDANGVQVPMELRSYPDNVKNFVQTGITSTNTVAVTNNTDRMNYRLAYTNMNHRGIVPNSDLFRNNLTLGTNLKATEQLTISANVNINSTGSNNRPASNRGTNPLEWAYKVPASTNILDLKDYWEPGQEGLQQRTPANGLYNNPYFLANEVNNSFNRDRIFGNIRANWQITPSFSFMGRYSLDRFNEKRETKIAPSYTRETNNGAYGIVDLNNSEQNIDVLATFAPKVKDFTISLSAGGNVLYSESSFISNSSKSSVGMIVPNVYSVSNIKAGALDFNSARTEKAIYSVYGMANIGFKDMIYLDLTARNDWSSTLPQENQSYFYPSVSLSVLANEMFDFGRQVGLVKLRGGWAKVGNDADPYQLYPTYGDIGQWGESTRLSKSGTILTPNLRPEEATSWEGGIDLSFFQNRLRFEGTYYEVENRNQIIRNIPIAASSGFDRININAGLISSRGWELGLGFTPVQTNALRWDLNTNFTWNRTRLDELSDGIDILRFWSDAKGGAWTYVGDDIGDIYDAKVLTVEDPDSPYFGYPILGGADFEWQDISAENTRNKVGNYNPDFILGFQNQLSYKNWTLNFTVDWRKGGQFISQTFRYMAEDASTQYWLDNLINPEGRTGEELRDWLVANQDEFILNGFHIVGGPTAEYGGFPEDFSGVVVNDGYFIPGVVQLPDGTYIENLGENNPIPYLPYIVSYPWQFASPSLFDADFVKLRELSLSYQMPTNVLQKLGNIRDLSISVYTRNVVLWTKAKIAIDPERAFQAEASSGNRGTQFKQGIERYNVEPWVLPVGFRLNFTF
ncbi:MAG: SusC/RagA family TonB-linked outer membrane protein [Saprospiraceae bacterium]|nr:SusC/RagA family TonB-linked outer membrane protein [Saprospiraceae bacterium]